MEKTFEIKFLIKSEENKNEVESLIYDILYKKIDYYNLEVIEDEID